MIIDAILYILAALIGLSLIIIIHELGHAWTAKLCGVYIKTFSLGFGKLLAIFKHNRTHYKIGMLPLGGYVAFFSTSDPDLPKDMHQHCYESQHYLKKIAICLAGPISNFILAIIILGGINLYGYNSIRPIISQVTPHSIAAKANLKPNTEIIAVNNHPSHSWSDIIMRLLLRLGSKNELKITTLNSANIQHSHRLLLEDWDINNKKGPLFSLGIIPFKPQPTISIAHIQPGSPAALRLRPGDIITSFNGNEIKSWSSLQQAIRQNPNTQIKLSLIRDHKPIHTTLRLSSNTTNEKKIGFLGIHPKIIVWPAHSKRFNQWHGIQAFVVSTEKTGLFIHLNGHFLYLILTNSRYLKQLGGPISIFESAQRAVKMGIINFLHFLALISISLGFLNLLPIPMLDGGQILPIVLEALKKEQLSTRFHIIYHNTGVTIILLLFLIVSYNDILRIFH